MHALLALVLLAAPVRMHLLETWAEHQDRLIIEAGAGCGVDPFLALELLHIEELAGLPARFRGLLVGKACTESRGQADAVGDGGKAVGMFQLWPWFVRAYGVDRLDPIASAHAYLQAIWVSFDHFVGRKCPGVSDPFRVAIIRVNRGPKHRGARLGQQRCDGPDPMGWAMVRAWL